jgi:hypothetical protein
LWIWAFSKQTRTILKNQQLYFIHAVKEYFEASNSFTDIIFRPALMHLKLTFHFGVSFWIRNPMQRLMCFR